MNFDLKKLLPHREPLLLIDRIVSNSKEELTAEVKIHESTFGFQDGGVPSWFGVEYMAQATAAFNSLNYQEPGQEPKIGFLVGVRGYSVEVPSFPLDSTVTVFVSPNFIVDNAGSFDCKIELDKKLIGSAVITTYMPDQPFLDQLKGEKNEQ